MAVKRYARRLMPLPHCSIAGRRVEALFDKVLESTSGLALIPLTQQLLQLTMNRVERKPRNVSSWDSFWAPAQLPILGLSTTLLSDNLIVNNIFSRSEEKNSGWRTACHVTVNAFCEDCDIFYLTLIAT